MPSQRERCTFALVDEVFISDYDYALPDARVAKYPLARRDESKLLVYRRGAISTAVFREVGSYLPEGGLLVFNNTRVIQARLHFRKASGAVIEVFLLDPIEPRAYEQMFAATGTCRWTCLVGNLKRWKGELLSADYTYTDGTFTLSAQYIRSLGAAHEVAFSWDSPLTWGEVIDIAGELPLPPYLHRAAEEGDKTTYQTIYSKKKGSVAAPTAGLHFTETVLADIDRRGMAREELTLHVGAGTFRPVKSDEIHAHEMHTEYIEVKLSTIEQLLQHDSKATAVGTTTVRTLESLYYIGAKIHSNKDIHPSDLHVAQWEPYEVQTPLSPAAALDAIRQYMLSHNLDTLHTSTQIIIVPGYKYKIVQALITNFHQPKSTLLLLVAALIGDEWRQVYDYALAHDYRFLSYGDACLFIP